MLERWLLFLKTLFMEKAFINETYRKLNSVRLGVDPIKQKKLNPGIIQVKSSADDDLLLECNYNSKNGILSGLAKLYKEGYLTDKAELEYEIEDPGTIKFQLEAPEAQQPVAVQEGEQAPPEKVTVFAKRNLKHIHIEPFRAENLKNWAPNAEVDIYMIFGHLEEYTEFKYCCGTNATLLKKLGYAFEENSKPDAILINRATDEYLITEFKMKSSQFKSNHVKDNIDVLVVWEDDEGDKALLPDHVICLSTIAKEAAIDNIQAE
jgi:hypothetical protein